MQETYQRKACDNGPRSTGATGLPIVIGRLARDVLRGLPRKDTGAIAWPWTHCAGGSLRRLVAHRPFHGLGQGCAKLFGRLVGDRVSELCGAFVSRAAAAPPAPARPAPARSGPS